MALTRIILWLGNSFILCASLMGITALASVLLLDMQGAQIFFALGLAISALGAVFIVATHNTPARETNADALLFLLLFWALIPFFLSLPYLSLRVVESPLAAYFEAVSAFTTTGASALEADSLPRSLLLWRSVVQWFGGVCVATFAVVILAALNLSGTGVHRSMLFTLKTGELFGRLLTIGKVIALIYGVLAAICWLLLALTGTDAFSALCLSLSGVSSGGLAPQSGTLSNYVGRLSALILAGFCILGAMNISILWDVIRLRRWKNVLSFFQNVEHRTILMLCAALSVAGIFFVGLGHAFTVIVESMFFVSTSGYDYSILGLELLPSGLLIAIALIGGSALSTAGGVKIIRMILLMRHLGTELGRLSHPSRIIPVIFRGEHIPDNAFLSIWMYFFGYTMFYGLGVLSLAMTGMNFEDAVATSAASISNIGPLLPATMPESELTYADFTLTQQIISSIFMLIGRVEVLAVLILIIPSFWKR